MTHYHHSFSQLLSAGIICLLVSGTLSAKTVFLVDNDLESKTEFRGDNWPHDRQSAQKYTHEIEKLAAKYLDRLTQLPASKAWCGADTEISLVLAKAKSLNLIEVDRIAPGTADISVKLPANLQAQTSQPHHPVKHLQLYVSPQARGNRSDRIWCIASRK